MWQIIQAIIPSLAVFLIAVFICFFLSYIIIGKFISFVIRPFRRMPASRSWLSTVLSLAMLGYAAWNIQYQTTIAMMYLVWLFIIMTIVAISLKIYPPGEDVMNPRYATVFVSVGVIITTITMAPTVFVGLGIYNLLSETSGYTAEIASGIAALTTALLFLRLFHWLSTKRIIEESKSLKAEKQREQRRQAAINTEIERAQASANNTAGRGSTGIDQPPITIGRWEV